MISIRDPVFRVAACAVLCIAHRASAETVTHIYAGYDLLGWPSRTVDEFEGLPGQNQLSISPSIFDPHSENSADAWAEINPRSDVFMRLAAEANTAGDTGYARSLIFQSFRDQITYLGEGTPSSLLLTFRFAGQLGFSRRAEGGPITGAEAQFGIIGEDHFGFRRVTTSSRPQASLYGVQLTSSYDYQQSRQEPQVIVGSLLNFDSGWLHASETAVDFNGTYTLEVTRKADETYSFGITTYALNELYSILDFTAFMDAGHTVGVTSVALSDGTEIDPGLLSFRSGFQFTTAAVPEPSTFVIACLGGVGFAAWSRYRGPRLVLKEMVRNPSSPRG